MAIFVPRFVRQLRDVLLTAPADGEVLTYDSADEKWKNEAGGGGGGDLSDAVILAPAASARNVIQPTDPDAIGLTIRAPVGSFEAETWILRIEDEFGNIRTQIDTVGDYDIRLNDDVDFPGVFKILAGAHGYPVFISQELGHLLRLFVGKKLSVLDSTNLNELFAVDEASGDVTVAGDLVVITTDSRLTDARTPTAHKTSHENGGGDEISLAGLDGTPVELTNHLTDAADAHDASAVSFVPTGTIAATDVQAAIAEVASEAGGGGISPTLFDANTVLAADTDDTPAALTMGASTILARLAAGNIKAASVSEIRTLLGITDPAMALLFDSTLGADAASIDITGISAAYKHLQIIASIRSTRAAQTTDTGNLRFNNDTAANYNTESVFGFGIAEDSVENLAATSIVIRDIPAVNTPGGYFAALTATIVNYSSATMRKTMNFQVAVLRDEATGLIGSLVGGGHWDSTAAIDRITLYAGIGNLLAGSRLTIYGLA